VAGFRLDAIQGIFEIQSLANDPQADKMTAPGYSWNLPEVHDVMRQLRTLINSYPGDRVLIGEVTEATTAELANWYGGTAHDQLQYPMDYSYGFPSLALHEGGASADRLDVQFYRRHLLDTSTQLNGDRPFIFFDNHDRPRSMDRFSDGSHRDEIAKVVAALLLTVPAAAQMYYGQEIGMVTTTPTRREDVKDPIGRTFWPENKGRDGERTPMQWTGGAQAGFSSNPKTWLPIPPNASMTNVTAQTGNTSSLLNWYKALITLRRDNASMRDGTLVLTDQSNENVLSYLRLSKSGVRSILVSINMSALHQDVAWQKVGIVAGSPQPHTLMSTPGVEISSRSQSVNLTPFGVWIADVN
jgi:alpha-glucosidase